MEKKLSEMSFDEKGIVKEIPNDLKKQISGMGIIKGKEVRMTTQQPIKGPVVVEVGRNNTSLGFNLADKIIVEIEK
ncbi:MAG: FeoA family protein [Candidatus Altiarchaeota archaeon]|nr:FeoA family protein [Candidatus Altiarchaeota archaeon]